ncbi:fungal-specific transcription factor domain-containing protein [Umbelopsis sp. AD052]|nr:fungal-specific transcription factor domain-containing protein [Umbelopsis sp. AD052]
MTTAMSASSNYAPPPLAASMSSSTSARDYYSSSSYPTFASAMRRASVDYKPTVDLPARSPPMPAATEDIMEGLESVQSRKRDVRLPSIADLAGGGGSGGQPSFSLSSSTAEEALSSQQLPPLNVQEYLFGIYFDHVYMFSPVVDRRDLETKLKVIRQSSSADKPTSPLSSSAASSVLLLAYSMMAVASEIIPSHITLPLFSHNEYVRHSAEVCSKHFFDRAMALADTLPTNQLSTISALCILSRYMGKNDQKQVDLTMSLLSRANRAAISFGLHMGEMVDQNWEDPRETLLRKKLFWSIFCHERLLGGLHARPFEIEEDEIYVDLPDRNSEAPVAYYLEKEETKKRESKRVLPYLNQPYLDDMLKTTIEKVYEDMETEAGTVDFFLAYIKLVKLMGRVVKHNNAQGARGDFWPVNTLHRALTNWMTGLPRKYQWSLSETYNTTESRAPVHVQLLHFLFHMTMLILHRPHAIGRQEVSTQHYFESSKSIILHGEALGTQEANVCYKDIIFQQALVCATRAQLDLLGSIVRQSSVTPSSTPSEVENLAVKSVNQLKAMVLSTTASSEAAKSRDDINVLYSAVVTLENDLHALIKKYRPDDERFGVPMSPEHKRDHDFMESVSESSSPAQTPEHKMDRPMLTPRSPRMKLAQIQQQKQQHRQSTGPSLMSLINGGRTTFGSDDGKSFEFVPAVFNAAAANEDSSGYHQQHSGPMSPQQPGVLSPSTSSSSANQQPSSHPRSLFQMILSSDRTPSPSSNHHHPSTMTPSYSTPTTSVHYPFDSSPSSHVTDLLQPRPQYSERGSPDHYSDTRSSAHPTSPSGSEASRSTDANLDQPMSLYHLAAAAAAAAADREGSNES